jgi:hypothetical protein
MKKLTSLLAFAGIATHSSMQANAQSKFDGFYGQVGIGYETVV